MRLKTLGKLFSVKFIPWKTPSETSPPAENSVPRNIPPLGIFPPENSPQDIFNAHSLEFTANNGVMQKRE